MALASAGQFAQDGHALERIIAFGQPRFTTAASVPIFSHLPLLRVVDENDLVAMLPPALTLGGAHGRFEHVGPEIILLEGRRYVYLAGHDANRLALGEFWRSMNVASLADHRMDRYIERLAAKAQGAEPVSYNRRLQFTAR